MSDNDHSYFIELDAADRKTVGKVIDEIVNSKIRAKAEADYQRDAKKDLADTYSINKTVLNKVIDIRFKESYAEEKEKAEGIIDAYEVLFGEVVDTATQTPADGS